MAYNQPDNLSLIATRTATNSANLEFKDCITANWSTYYLSIRNIVPATLNADFNVVFSNDNGATYLAANYKYSYLNQMTNGTLVAIGSNSAATAQLQSTSMNTSNAGICADIYFYNMKSASVPCFYKGRLTHFYDTSTGNYNNQICGSNTDTTGINALKFTFSSGNITSGIIYLFGVNEP